MKNELGMLEEYEQMLLGQKGNRNKFSPKYIKIDSTIEDVRPVLKYAFCDLLGWGPEEIFFHVNKEICSKLRLGQVINKVEFPVELNRETDYYYLANVVYPGQVRMGKPELVLALYKRILDGEIQKIPKNLFYGVQGDYHLSICLQYALDNYLVTTGPEDLYERFSNAKWARSFLKKVKLYIACRDLFDLPIDMLHTCLPENQKDELLYRFYRVKAAIHSLAADHQME